MSTSQELGSTTLLYAAADIKGRVYHEWNMTTSFSALPIVDLSLLSGAANPEEAFKALSQQLYSVFSTTGFAYLVNTPLSFSHADVFGLAHELFTLPGKDKMALAKKTFVPANSNTYRGYFPTQPGQTDNLKEGFEIGAPQSLKNGHANQPPKFDLAETNVWPPEETFEASRLRLETLHAELQTLSAALLSLLAVGLGRPADYFASYVEDSLSTLRLLHYPPQPIQEVSSGDQIKLCCTPHTDSGILTLLHQDQTGGLEVLNADGEWIAAPYVADSMVVNIGDLMAQVSGGRLIATKHRVRISGGHEGKADGLGRFSVPFFFEPGETCVVKSIDGGDGILYGEYVRRKMGTWVEYQDRPDSKIDDHGMGGFAVKAC